MEKKRRARGPKIPKNVSRQRAWQLRQRGAGLCTICAQPAWREGAAYCPEHRAAHNEREKLRWQRKMNPPPPPSLW